MGQYLAWIIPRMSFFFSWTTAKNCVNCWARPTSSVNYRNLHCQKTLYSLWCQVSASC